MITVTNRDTCRAAYIDEKNIVKMSEHSEEVSGVACPYTRVYVKDEKQKHDYFLDVVDSKRKIQKLIEEAKKHPVKEKLGPPLPEDP